MSNIVFYTNPMSRGQTIRWMLEEVGEPYETHILDYAEKMKAPDYLAINPMGKVPAIVHEGKVVTECAAICAYLADAFPAAGLAPRPHERADYYRWMFFAAGPVEASVTNRAAGFTVEPGRERMFGYGTYDLTMDVLEGAVSGRDYICGTRFTAADIYVGSQIDWGLMFGSMPDRPAFATYVERLRQRPAYQRAKQIDNALIAKMQPPAG
ncbi:glutathione S-transferase family protein [Sphingobium nicotianae]|uniref:Glutathione S-transferase family protein n=1 Tax=Sphingobium nicotianae TaxID=2782607 RepID=A0A9X1IQU3_9SPHN|nr:glutathione S-transferase family protein [Sphingobium nicotianae]MBT2186869.1 glutathione S-transferase family protein [Sphingobium nicotianae]